MVAHLSTDEVYDQVCLDNSLEKLGLAGDWLDTWNERGVRERRHLTPVETLAEWERLQRDVRRRWGRLGLAAKIPTSVGPYPLRLQVWHLAREYAIHADDIGVPVPALQRRARWRWRIPFGIFAAREEGEPVDARVKDSVVLLRHRSRAYELDPDTFIAFLANRPQHLTDPEKRRLLARLGRRG